MQLGPWVASTSSVTLAIFLLLCTLVSLGEGVWSPWSWSLCGVGVVCPSQGYLGSVILAFLGLEACSSGWVFWEVGAVLFWSRRAGSWELMGMEGFQEP